LKTIKLLLVTLASLIVVACGGGGGSNGTSGAAGTAAQYFTKNTVGNTWTWLQTNTQQVTGKPTTTTTSTRTRIITAFSGGTVTFFNTTTSNGVTSPGYTLTTRIDATGAMVSTDGSTNYLDIPATFSVGTTWDSQPAIGTQSAVKVTVVAFNVTRTVPAGTFTDCLQVNIAYSDTTAGVTTATNATIYISPVAGGQVDTIGVTTSTNAGVVTTSTDVEQLQAGYIANDAIPTGITITAMANTTAQNLTVGTAMSSFTPLTASGGYPPYTYSYVGALPMGLSFNSNTGAITGTPTTAYAAANLKFSVNDAGANVAKTTSTVNFSVSGISALPAGYAVQGGLTWMPITFQDTWTSANAYCANTVINGLIGWRLPTKDELAALDASGTMVGKGSSLPTYLPTWSSTLYLFPGFHYQIILGLGSPLIDLDAGSAYVTCVR
jgi:hypothetical protein